MVTDFEKRLDFDSDTFEDMKKDMNLVLQRLIGNMQEKGTDEGSMTLKIEVTMAKEYIPNYDPNIKGETREISKPQFKHKVTSAVKINDEKSGNLNNEMEVYMDEEIGLYKLRPIANTTQRSIFDSDFQEMSGDGQEDGGDDKAADEKNGPLMLTGPVDELESDASNLEDGEVIDGEFREVEPGAGLDDITDELLGEDDSEEDDGYSYEEPEDE